MKIIFTIFTALIAVTITYSQNITALMPLKYINIDQSDAEMVYDKILTEITKSKCIQVIEREEMAAILKEQGFQLSGCTDNSCAVEVGKMLNANSIIVGTIGKVQGNINLHLRQIDVKSSKILATANEDKRSDLWDFYKYSIEKAVKKLCQDSKNGSIEKGIYFFENGLYDRAIDEFTDIIQKEPDNIAARYWRARSTYFRGYNYEAIPKYKELKTILDSLNELSLKAIKTINPEAMSKYKSEEDLVQNRLNEIISEYTTIPHLHNET